jgi:hypothetical protein
VTAEPATSLTTLLNGLRTVEAEAGLSILGALIAALPIVLLASLRRRILAAFRGQAAEGTVTQAEVLSATGGVKAHVKFHTSDGRKIDVPLKMAPGVRVGDTVPIRYDRARPEAATNRTATAVATHILLPLGAFAAVGLAGPIGTFWGIAAGDFNGFSNVYLIVLLLTSAAFAFLSAGIRYAETTAAQLPTGRIAAARSARGPAFVGLLLLTLGVYLAVVLYG